MNVHSIFTITSVLVTNMYTQTLFWLQWWKKRFNKTQILINTHCPGIILYMRPANARRRYSATPSLIGWAHTDNDPCLQVTHSKPCFQAYHPIVTLITWELACYIYWILVTTVDSKTMRQNKLDHISYGKGKGCVILSSYGDWNLTKIHLGAPGVYFIMEEGLSL